MSKPARSHTILIAPDGDGGFVASPSPLLIEGLDEVNFLNKTAADIKIQFSKMAAFNHHWLLVTPGSQESVTANNPPDLLVCHFAAYITEPGRFAHGSAMPIIIVEPKD